MHYFSVFAHRRISKRRPVVSLQMEQMSEAKFA